MNFVFLFQKRNQMRKIDPYRFHIQSETNQSLLDKYSENCSPEQIYQAMGELVCGGQDRVRNALRLLATEMTVWDTTAYSRWATKEREELEFRKTPFQVEEGIIQCKKCGSKRTLSFQKQTRSADEGMTTFYQCVECGAKARYSI